MVPIVIPFDDDIDGLRQRLNHHPCPAVYTRKLQRFTVQVYPYEFEALKEVGAISETKVGELFWFLDDKKYYNMVSGLLDVVSRKDRRPHFAHRQFTLEYEILP